ncbi:hypothetical protein K502DRAFT_235221 [Neoconidiobolus thromboides FSU 785]|nr:hypothetical protein K502DRAFT_235221 [Neoconidiobolus thromboides FSU 785]
MVLLYIQSMDLEQLVEAISKDFESQYSLFTNDSKTEPLVSNFEIILKRILLIDSSIARVEVLVVLYISLDKILQNQEYNGITPIVQLSKSVIFHIIKELFSSPSRVITIDMSLESYLSIEGWEPDRTNIYNNEQETIKRWISTLLYYIVETLNINKSSMSKFRLDTLIDLLSELLVNNVFKEDYIEYLSYILNNLQSKLPIEFLLNSDKEKLLKIPSIYFSYTIFNKILHMCNYDDSIVEDVLNKNETGIIGLKQLSNIFILKATGIISYDKLPEINLNIDYSVNNDSITMSLIIMYHFIRYIEININTTTVVPYLTLYNMTGISLQLLTIGMKVRYQLKQTSVLYKTLIKYIKKVLLHIHYDFKWHQSLSLVYEWGIKTKLPTYGIKRTDTKSGVEQSDNNKRRHSFYEEAKLHGSISFQNHINYAPFTKQLSESIVNLDSLYIINIVKAYISKDENIVNIVKSNIMDYLDIINTFISSTDNELERKRLFFLMCKDFDHFSSSIKDAFYLKKDDYKKKIEADAKNDMDIFVFDIFKDNPILIEFIQILSYDFTLFHQSSGFWKRLLLLMMQFWNIKREGPSSSFPSELYLTCSLIKCLNIVKALPSPFNYVVELLPLINYNEVGAILYKSIWPMFLVFEFKETRPEFLPNQEEVMKPILDALRAHPLKVKKIINLFQKSL